MVDLPFRPKRDQENSYGFGPGLDELWADAEAIGKLEIDHPFGETGYQARIAFDIRASRVWSTGHGASIHEALQAAIAEARRLKGSLQ
jgi:hypothetical protein